MYATKNNNIMKDTSALLRGNPPITNKKSWFKKIEIVIRIINQLFIDKMIKNKEQPIKIAKVKKLMGPENILTFNRNNIKKYTTENKIYINENKTVILKISLVILLFVLKGE